MNTAAEDLKTSILLMAAALRESFSRHNAAILNARCAELRALTGEVYVNGAFVVAA
jgi:hypothetical protein